MEQTTKSRSRKNRKETTLHQRTEARKPKLHAVLLHSVAFVFAQSRVATLNGSAPPHRSWGRRPLTIRSPSATRPPSPNQSWGLTGLRQLLPSRALSHSEPRHPTLRVASSSDSTHLLVGGASRGRPMLRKVPAWTLRPMREPNPKRSERGLQHQRDSLFFPTRSVLRHDSCSNSWNGADTTGPER